MTPFPDTAAAVLVALGILVAITALSGAMYPPPWLNTFAIHPDCPDMRC